MQVSWTTKKTTEFRDIQVGDDMRKKAELGWFDEEFTMYGCAYYDMKKEKVFYRVSSEAADIYSFLERAVIAGVYPSNVESITKKCPVPSGMREIIAEEVKKQMAKILQQIFPRDFFHLLCYLGDLTEKSAKRMEKIESMLWEEAYRLEGTFDEDRLYRFQALIEDERRRKVISEKEYLWFVNWLKEERRNLENDAVRKERFEKTLYGIVVPEKSGYKTVINAQQEYICQKYYDDVIAGKNVSPIYQKKYWYACGSSLGEVKTNFKQELLNLHSAEYLNWLAIIRKVEYNNSVCQEARELLTETQKRFGEHPYWTLKRYVG